MFRVSCAARRFNLLATRGLAADGLNFLDGLVLVAIFFEAPRQTKPSELAETLATTRGNVSHSISSLEAKGLVRRKIDPEDARAYLLTLKPAGKRAAFRVISAFDQMQRAFEAEVGKTALADALKVIRALEQKAEGQLA